MKKQFLLLVASAGIALSTAVLPDIALAQRVVEVTPPQNSRTVPPDTSISGQFDTRDGAVDVNSVRILVNGRDVTQRSTITRSFFTYRPDQPFTAGQQVRVEVLYRNTSGQDLSTAWAFTVQSNQPGPQISAVTHTAIAAPQAPGSNFRVTINGTPGSQAAVLLVQDGRTVREVAAQETSSGVYTATIPVRQGDRVGEGVVVARLRRNNQTTFAAAAQPFEFAVNGRPTTPTPPPGSGTTRPTEDLRPRFTSHRTGDQVDGTFTLVGQTQPNATVNVKVSYGVSVLGVDVVQQPLLDRDVQADRNGQFRLEVSGPRLPVPGVRYTVRATSRSGNETSQETQLVLEQRR